MKEGSPGTTWPEMGSPKSVPAWARLLPYTWDWTVDSAGLSASGPGRCLRHTWSQGSAFSRTDQHPLEGCQDKGSPTLHDTREGDRQACS